MILFIANRFLKSRKNSSGFSIFSLIAILGIAIGVASLIIAINVLDGFDLTIREKVENLDSHIQIVGFSDLPINEKDSTDKRVKELIPNQLVHIDKYVSRLVIAGTKKIKEGVQLKGVGADYFRKKEGLKIIEGERNLSNNTNFLLVGKTLANKLRVKIDDEIVVYSVGNNQYDIFSSNIEKIKVTGIFESGLAKFDDAYIYTNIDSAKMFLMFRKQVSGYEIKLNSLNNIDSIVNHLQNNLRYPNYVKSVFDSYKHIFNWIELQKKPIPLILGLIILVAVFNIISTLLMIILEKINSVGVLRSLGAKQYQIIIIFLLHGITIGVIGVLFGNFLAVGLSYLQNHYDVITLPGTIYFISKVPLIINLSTNVLVSIITLALVLVVSIIPSIIAARISPLFIIRFK